MSRMWRSLPFVLLGLLTLATLGIPLALWIVLGRGGHPDKFTVWTSFGAASALVAVLMAATIAASLAHQRAQRRAGALERKEREGQ